MYLPICSSLFQINWYILIYIWKFCFMRFWSEARYGKLEWEWDYHRAWCCFHDCASSVLFSFLFIMQNSKSGGKRWTEEEAQRAELPREQPRKCFTVLLLQRLRWEDIVKIYHKFCNFMLDWLQHAAEYSNNLRNGWYYYKHEWE